MPKVDNNDRKNIKAFVKFMNGWIKFSVKNRIETLTDSSGSSFSSHVGKVKILKSHYEKLGSELNMKSIIHERRKYPFQWNVLKLPYNGKVLRQKYFANQSLSGISRKVFLRFGV